MDTRPKQEDHPLLDAVAKAARRNGLGLEIVQMEPTVGREHADALVRITRGGIEALYAAEVRRAVQPATLGAALHKLARLGPQALLVTDYLTPPVADELKARNVAFMDRAGNAYLDQPNLFIWITGRKPEQKPATMAAGRAFQPNGLKVIFVLLCNPAIVKEPFRKLATMANTAHGTVGIVMQDLQAQGFVDDLKGKRGTRRLFQRQRLLDQWTDAYMRVLRPRTLIGRYYVPTIDDWENWNIQEHGARWGGEPAAARLTRHLRPGELTIYADHLPGRLAAMKRFAKEPEPGRTAVVEVRRPFWKFAIADTVVETVPPVLVYADLLATGDARCLEAATTIRETHVARLLPEI